MARRYWPEGQAVGRQMTLGGGTPPIEIVGIARDITYYSVGESPRPYFYLPFGPMVMDALTFQFRTTGPDASLAQTVRRLLRDADSRIRVPFALAFEQARQMPLYPSRAMAIVSGTFGTLALLLTMIGLYGVVVYAASQRTREFAVRIALGARPGDILRGVVRQGLVMAGIGLVVGVAGALALARLLRGFLVGVSPFDPVTIAGWCAVLAALALVASYVPAKRATRIDPAAVLAGRN
jgi:ABC-type antimicrobial peptide transport system permease subunit